MGPRKRQQNRDLGDGPRKRPRADEQNDDSVVISDSDEDEVIALSPREERKRERESKTRSNEMTEEEMLALAMKLSEKEASSAALRQRQEEEAMRKAIAESLSEDRPTRVHSTKKCQSSPPKEGSSIQPPRRKLAYPNNVVADRDETCSAGVNVELACTDRQREARSPLPDMPDLSQTQKVNSKFPLISQDPTSETLHSSQEEGPSQKKPIEDLSDKAMEFQDCSNSTKTESQSQLSSVLPLTMASQTSIPVVCLKKLSHDLVVGRQASGIILKGHPKVTPPRLSQIYQSSQPKDLVFSKSPVFSKIEKEGLMFSQSSETDSGKEDKEECPVFLKNILFSSSDTGEEEKETSPTFPRSPVFRRSPGFSKPNTEKGVDQGSTTCTKSHVFAKTVRRPDENEKSPTFPKSPVFPRGDEKGDPQTSVECVSTTELNDNADQEAPDCSSPAVKPRDVSQRLLSRPRTKMSLHKRLVPLRTSQVIDKVVDRVERDGESSQGAINAVSTLSPAEEDHTPVLETQPIPEVTGNMKTQPIPKLTSDMKTQPIPELTSDMKTQPIPELTSNMETQPIPELTSNMETQPIPELTSDMKTQPIPELTSNMKTQPIPELTSNMKTQPIPELTSNMKTQPIPELTSDMKTQPTPELTRVMKTQPTPELTSNMALYWSDDDEGEDGPVKLSISPSPVFPQEKNLLRPSGSPDLNPNKHTDQSQDPTFQEVKTEKKLAKKFTFRGMYGDPTLSLPRQPTGNRDGSPDGPPSSQQPVASASGHRSPTTDSHGDQGVIRYYWGVPFCPRGQNPDTYTQVILSQLEVYEKSLKDAQRGLLSKCVWGEPVLPGPPERPFTSRGRPKRHRAPQLLEDEEEERDEDYVRRGKQQEEEVVEVLEVDDGDDGGDEEEEREKTGRLPFPMRGKEDKSLSPVSHAESSQQQQLLPRRRLKLRKEVRRPAETRPPDRQVNWEEEEEEEEHKRDAEQHGENVEAEMGSDRKCERTMGEVELDVSGSEVPETQFSDDSTPELMVINTPPPQPQSQPLPQIQIFLSSPRPLEQTEERMEVDGEGRESHPEGSPATGEDVRMEEEQETEEPWGVQESPPPQTTSVDCPMCMRPFPMAKIEMHAAYCDGSSTDLQEEEMMAQEIQSQVAVKACRKRTRRGELIGEEKPSSSGSNNRVGLTEKCYLCQQLFAPRDYVKHVEDCVKSKQVTRTASRTAQSGHLLRALDQTEYRGNAEAGPCDTTFQNQYSVSSDDQAESGGSGDRVAPGFIVSTSPIRSFTSISEATDCLIDFKHQYSSSSSSNARPGQRGRKFKRKFKR
ncbi:hypothetical protein DPEC_G00224910 [Dallia pectoralis]|uniref:Uncharacterized protein n=1 Tax=Dallia pectoralis TaxID=75939 RepID=A0ACC2G0L0_DALPE|nr:hypothetical protein DPEC_G00224910 [Dallia pectoralis]